MCPRLGLILFCWFFVAQLLDGEVEAFQKQPLGGTELASQVAQAPYRGAHHPSDLAAGGTSDPTGNSTGGEGAGAPSLTEFSGRTGPGEATRHDVRPVAMRLWGYVQADGHVLPGMRSEMGSDQLCGLRSGGAGTLAMGLFLAGGSEISQGQGQGRLEATLASGQVGSALLRAHPHL